MKQYQGYEPESLIQRTNILPTEPPGKTRLAGRPSPLYVGDTATAVQDEKTS